MKKKSKTEILWHGVLLCVLVASKNDKLEFLQTFQKIHSQKSLSCTDIHGFQAK